LKVVGRERVWKSVDEGIDGVPGWGVSVNWEGGMALPVLWSGEMRGLSCSRLGDGGAAAAGFYGWRKRASRLGEERIEGVLAVVEGNGAAVL
jgi:hypothetical protein